MDQGTAHGPGHQGSEHYHRDRGVYGSADKLEALGQASVALSWLFGINIVLSITINAYTRSAPVRADAPFVDLIVALVIMFLLVGLASLPVTKNLAIAKGWSPMAMFGGSFLIALNSALCCGLVGYIVLGSIISSELGRYGLKSSSFRIKSPLIEERVRAMRKQEADQGEQAQTPFAV